MLVGEDVKELLECDFQIEKRAIPDLREAIAYCEEVRDFVSRDMLSEILASEEEHYDYLETQLQLIEKMGLQNYLQSQV